MTYDPSGKFHKISTGDLPLPAQCGSCGKVEDPEGFVDTSLNFEFFGALTFCCSCAFEMTTVFPEAPYHTMRQRILQLEEAVLAKDATIASLERSIDGLTAARLSERGFTDVSGVPVVSAEPESEEVTDGNDPGLTVVESVLAESSKGKRPVQPAKPQRSDPIITDV